MFKLNRLALFFSLSLGMSFWATPLVAAPNKAPGNTPLLTTQILFAPAGKAAVKFDSHGQNAEETVNNKIQSALIFYAYTMHQLGETDRLALMNQVQKNIPRLATDQGLQRADLFKGNPLIKNQGQDLTGKGFSLVFQKESTGNSLQVTPLADSTSLLVPATFYYFQNLVDQLPENGFRLLVLAMGGMNKYYREVGKASDPMSLSAAPAYGLNLAVDIIAKVSGTKI